MFTQFLAENYDIILSYAMISYCPIFSILIIFISLGFDPVKLERRLRDHPNQIHECLPHLTLGSNPDDLLDALNNSLFPRNFLSNI